jgi:glycosyltransferase involved in cell wall biosynthesis
VRIAIDARELSGTPTGVGRFLGEILREWAQMPEAAEHEFIYCAPGDIAGITVPPSAQPDSVRDAERQFRHGESAVEPGSGTLWEQRTLPRLARRANADVLFCPAYSGPIYGRVPRVVAIHDVSFAAHPEWFRWREGLRRRILTRRAARKAGRVITISEFSRGQIVEHLGVAASKIDVIYPGASRVGARVQGALDTNSRSGADPLLLYVGSIFNRRHVPETIRGFARLARRHPDARLTIVGDNRTFPAIRLEHVIDDTDQRDRVAVRPYASDAELADLYGRARAFVFLSEYEGFGLTPLEALACGVPIVVLDTPVAREVYGRAAIYVTAPEPRLIEPALDLALYDEEARAQVLAEAAAVVARYSWRECAGGVLRALVSVAHEYSDRPHPRESPHNGDRGS